MTILDELERQKRAAQIAEWDKNEKALASRLPPFSQKPLTETETTALGPFLKWCQQNAVRHCPCRPATLAAWIVEQEYKAPPVETLLAIERMHDSFNLPNPVTTSVVRAALAPLIDDVPPRAWSAQEKAKFLDASVELREIIARRSKQRETAFSRLQNENGQLRNALSDKITQANTDTATKGAEPEQRISAASG